MIFRFLDKSGRCCQICAPETPVLVYFTAEEKEKLINSDQGNCLIMISNEYNEKQTQEMVDALNTKEDPITMK